MRVLTTSRGVTTRLLIAEAITEAPIRLGQSWLRTTAPPASVDVGMTGFGRILWFRGNVAQVCLKILPCTRSARVSALVGRFITMCSLGALLMGRTFTSASLAKGFMLPSFMRGVLTASTMFNPASDRVALVIGRQLHLSEAAALREIRALPGGAGPAGMRVSYSNQTLMSRHIRSMSTEAKSAALQVRYQYITAV
jgi:hypothetical protein